MSAVHLHIPAAPNVAACGDATAKRFTPWRWKATCKACKMLTAARQFDDQKHEHVQFRRDLPVRYSRLVEHLRKHTPAEERARLEQGIAEFERERKTAAICTKCGPLADPIALFDVPNFRMVFACPNCSQPAWRARWEAEK